MAKNRNKNIPLDDFDDDDLKILEGFDNPFKDTYEPEPKNSREAAERTVKNFGKGLRDGVMDNKMFTITNAVKDTMPSSLSEEFDAISDLYSGLNNVIGKGVNDLKKESLKFIKIAEKVAPKGKIADLLGKIRGKLSDADDRINALYKEQEQNAIINNEILQSLGDITSAQQQNEAIRQVIQSKQYASTIDVLKNIYAEQRLVRDFQVTVSNNYYRKSLELQYKHLFVSKEMFELSKASLETMKKQLENIVRNTSIPDYLKLRGFDLTKYTFKKQFADSASGAMFKKITHPLKRVSDNIVKNTRDVITGFMDPFSMLNDQLDMSADMAKMLREVNGNNSMAYAIGNYVPSLIFGSLGRRLGTAMEKNKNFRRRFMRMRDAAGDPTTLFQNLANNNGTRIFDKFKSGFGKIMLGFTKSDEENTARFDREDLDQAGVFDNRTRLSIVRIIPDLLSKIYGEVKTVRLGLNITDDPSKHEVYFNTGNYKLQTKSEIQKHYMGRHKESLRDAAADANKIMEIFSKARGKGFSKKEKKAFSLALLEHFSKSSSGPNNIGFITSKSFLNVLNHDGLKKDLAKKDKKIYKYFEEDQSAEQQLRTALIDFKRHIPKNADALEEIYKSLSGDFLTGIDTGNGEFVNLVTQNADGSYTENTEGIKFVNRKFFNGAFANGEVPRYTERERRQKEIDAKRDTTAKEGKNNLKISTGEAADTLKSKLKNSETGGAASTVTTVKEKGEEVLKEKGLDTFNGRRGGFVDASIFLDLRDKGIAKLKSGFNFLKSKLNVSKDKAVEIFTNPNIKTNDMLNSTNIAQNASNNKKKAIIAIRNRVIKIKESIDKAIAKAKTNEEKRRLLEIKEQLDNNIGDIFNYFRSSKVYKNVEDNIKKMLEDTENAVKNVKDKKTESILDKTRRMDQKIASWLWALPGNIASGVGGAIGMIPSVLGGLGSIKNIFTGKGKGKGKSILDRTRALDRKIAPLLWKAPFVAGAYGLKGAGLLTKLGLSAGLKGTAWYGKELTKSLGGAAGFVGRKLLGLGPKYEKKKIEVEKMKIDKEHKELKNEDSNRKGGWRERLSGFFKKKDLTADGGKSKAAGGLLGLLGKIKILPMGLALMGILGIMKLLNVNVVDVVKGVVKVGKGIHDVISTLVSLPMKIGAYIKHGLKNTLSLIPGIGKFFQGGDDDLENDLAAVDKKSSTAGKLGVGFVAANILSSRVRKLTMGVFKLGKGAFGAGSKLLGFGGSKVAEAATEAGGKKGIFSRLWEGAKKLFTRLKNGKVISKLTKTLGKSTVKKAVTRVAAIAGANVVPGLGTLISIGLSAALIWGIVKALRAGKSPEAAVSESVLGVDITGSDYDPANIDKEDAEDDAEFIDYGTTSSSSPSAVSNAMRVETTTPTSQLNTTTTASKLVDKYAAKYTDVPTNTNSKYTDSPYIQPNPQQSLNGELANVKDLNPLFRSRLYAFAKEYYEKTGKKLQVNSGLRTLQQQQYMYNLFGPKVAAYPSPNAPHTRGVAADIQWQNDGVFGIPRQGQYSPIIDGTLAKYGLKRLWNKQNERQHVYLDTGADVQIDDSDVDVNKDLIKVANREQKEEQKELSTASAPVTTSSSAPSYASNNLSTVTTPIIKTSTSAATTTTKVDRNASVSGSELLDIQKKSLFVQAKLLDITEKRVASSLESILEILTNGKVTAAQQAKQQEESNNGSSFPEIPIIDLKRREEFITI